ncbi:MAG: hypothetical protein ACRDNK_04985, partial [Solirubrobacteraceae bacterium]
LGSEWIGTPPNQRWDCYDEARSILESGELPLEQLVTRQCDLHGIDAVLASFGSDPQPKSILTPGGTQ